MFWDFSSAKFEAPKGSGKHTIFAGNLWVGGIDANNNLHTACQTYRQAGTDFWPGPLDTNNAQCQTTISNQWSRVWKINKCTIDSFINGLYTSTPSIITNWPGNGPGGSYPYNVAPFHDANADGIYSPTNGDYPLIRGDQAIFFVYNDNTQGFTHTETGGLPFGIEIRGMAYQFNCPADSALMNTVFIHYDIINRSFTNYNNVYLGMWTDLDVGNYADDYIGCDVPRKMYYGYNGDANDDANVGGYGTKLSAQGVVFLKGPTVPTNDNDDNNRNCITDEPGEDYALNRFMYYENDASVRGNPTNDSDFYAYLGGQWRDYTPLCYGGTGYNTGSPCYFAFPGNTDHQYEFGVGGTCLSPGPPQSDWDEVTGGSQPGDRRGLGICGPFTMQPGSTKTLDVAYVFSRDYTASGIDTSIVRLQTRADSIISHFNNTTLSACGCGLSSGLADVKNNTVINVFPNPAQTILNVQLPETEKIIFTEIYSATGALVKTIYASATQINITDLTDGIYTLRIVTEGNNFVSRFVKN